MTNISGYVWPSCPPFPVHDLLFNRCLPCDLPQVTDGGSGQKIRLILRRPLFFFFIKVCSFDTISSVILGMFPNQGPVSRKPRKRFGPGKPFLVNLYLKTEECTPLKLGQIFHNNSGT